MGNLPARVELNMFNFTRTSSEENPRLLEIVSLKSKLGFDSYSNGNEPRRITANGIELLLIRTYLTHVRNVIQLTKKRIFRVFTRKTLTLAWLFLSKKDTPVPAVTIDNIKMF